MGLYGAQLALFVFSYRYIHLNKYYPYIGIYFHLNEYVEVMCSWLGGRKVLGLGCLSIASELERAGQDRAKLNRKAQAGMAFIHTYLCK